MKPTRMTEEEFDAAYEMDPTDPLGGWRKRQQSQNAPNAATVNAKPGESALSPAGGDKIAPLPSKRATGHPGGSGMTEKALQTAAEGWLNIRGYWRSTALNAETKGVHPDYLPSLQKGWFFHWPQAIGNPLCADLLIQNVALTRSIWLELKVRDKYQRGQKEHIDAGRWNECRTLDDVMNAVQLWELIT